MQEVYAVMGIHKVNTTAHHPQTNGLVEQFNRTLIDMIAKSTDPEGRDWEISALYIYPSGIHWGVTILIALW